MKYTQEELTELAKGVFIDDKTSPSIYANEDGTFLNTDQYDKLSDEKKDDFTEFKNPSVKALDGKPSAEQEAKIVELETEIERLNGLKSVAAVKTAEAETERLKGEVDRLDAIILELNKKVLELQPQ